MNYKLKILFCQPLGAPCKTLASRLGLVIKSAAAWFLTGGEVFSDPAHRSPFLANWRDFAPRLLLTYQFLKKGYSFLEVRICCFPGGSA
jgi:hypothetical protein